jgi:hypothetical protein
MSTFIYDETAKLYQAGLTREDAIAKGADAEKFDALEVEFKGGSIPVHVIRGFKPAEPYSCEYHTGGKKGALLREIAKRSKE